MLAGCPLFIHYRPRSRSLGGLSSFLELFVTVGCFQRALVWWAIFTYSCFYRVHITKNVLICAGLYKKKEIIRRKFPACVSSTHQRYKAGCDNRKKGGKIKDILPVGAKNAFEFSEKRDIQLRRKTKCHCENLMLLDHKTSSYLVSFKLCPTMLLLYQGHFTDSCKGQGCH